MSGVIFCLQVNSEPATVSQCCVGVRDLITPAWHHCGSSAQLMPGSVALKLNSGGINELRLMLAHVVGCSREGEPSVQGTWKFHGIE